ncbi:MAG: helix-turn-helix domain-containing protein [Oscillospiraceae bacterium]
MVFDGKKLKHYRLESGLSQTKLAARAGVSSRYIGELERGEKDNPSAKLLKRICMVWRYTDTSKESSRSPRWPCRAVPR